MSSVTPFVAGTYAAHAVWCLVDSDNLTPMVAFSEKSGKQGMVRMMSDDAGEGVQMAACWIDENASNLECATVYFVGYIPLKGQRTECLIMQIHDFNNDYQVVLAIPLINPGQGETFAFHGPTLVDVEGQTNWEEFLHRFADGIEAHEEGGAAWRNHLYSSSSPN